MTHSGKFSDISMPFKFFLKKILIFSIYCFVNISLLFPPPASLFPHIVFRPCSALGTPGVKAHLHIGGAYKVAT